MSQWYKKHHSFRLRKEDAQLYNHLEGSKNKSETIRLMLLFALENMDNEVFEVTEEVSEDNYLKGVVEEIRELKEIQAENHKALMDKISDGVIQTNSTEAIEEEKEEKSDISEESNKENLGSFFDAFGVNL